VNSLLQTYYFLPQFRELVLKFRPFPEDWDLSSAITVSDNQDFQKSCSIRCIFF